MSNAPDRRRARQAAHAWTFPEPGQPFHYPTLDDPTHGPLDVAPDPDSEQPWDGFGPAPIDEPHLQWQPDSPPPLEPAPDPAISYTPPPTHPAHGPMDALPRREDGSISPYYYCTPEEIAAGGLTPPPRRRRHDGATPERIARFIEILGVTASVSAACRASGLSRATVYKLRARADAGAFRQAWDEALAQAVGVLADVAFERAVLGWQEPVFHGGHRVGSRTRYDNRLLQFLLRVRDPHRFAPVDELDRWKRHRAVEGGGGAERLAAGVEQAEQAWAHAPLPPPPEPMPADRALAWARGETLPPPLDAPPVPVLPDRDRDDPVRASNLST